ncbi:hypothetical protein ACSBR1_029809 [Camellia fascicularis]
MLQIRVLFCEIEEESSSYLLLHCQFSWKVWAEISIRWGFSWAIPSSLSDLLEWWYSQKSKLQGKLIWEAIPLATLWTLWLARNEKIFNNKDPNWEELGGEH